MGFAEKKVTLLKIVAEADEELTGLLIEFAHQYKSRFEKFSSEELEKFHASRQAYLQHPESSLLLEDAHTYIRSLKNK